MRELSTARRTGGGTTQFSREGRDRVRTALTTAGDMSGPSLGCVGSGSGGSPPAAGSGRGVRCRQRARPPAAPAMPFPVPADGRRRQLVAAGGAAHREQDCARSARIGILASRLAGRSQRARRAASPMARLQQTEGLSDEQRELLAVVREFVDEQILPVATALEHADEYPTKIVEQMQEMGIFGLMIPEEYGGARRVAADLRAHRRGARARLDVRQRHHQHPLHRRVHAPAARDRGAEAALPAADGHRRGARRVLDERAGLRHRRQRDPHQSRSHAGRPVVRSPARRCGSPTAARPTSSPSSSRPTPAPSSPSTRT